MEWPGSFVATGFNKWGMTTSMEASMIPSDLVQGRENHYMGCALKWNPQEHSWDCPCHGSRFTKTGRVLENPANGDLKI